MTSMGAIIMARYFAVWESVWIDEKERPIYLAPLCKNIRDLTPHIVRTVPLNRKEDWVRDLMIWKSTRKGAQLHGVYNLVNGKLVRNKKNSKRELDYIEGTWQYTS